MRISSPSTNWSLAQNSNQKILQWKIYARKVTTLNESLTGGTTFTDITEYIKEIPSISQAIELEVGQFTSDSFGLSCTDVNYWLVNWMSLTSGQEIEVKVVFNMGISSASMSSDNCIVASGFVDKMSFELDEASDSVSFTVESYDEYANRITGKNLTLQKTRTFTKTNPTTHDVTCLVCNKIPGVYIQSVSPYLYLQSLSFQWNESDSVYQIKYNGGDWTTLSNIFGYTITAIQNVFDEKNNKCEIFFIPYEFEKKDSEQKFILKNASDSLPYVFYEDETIANMLTNVVNELPIVSSSITAPTFSPYDSGYRLCSLENIANNIGNAAPKCIEWDSTNSLFWVGIGNKLYTRTTGGTWTYKANVGNTYSTIKRIWTNRIASPNRQIWMLVEGGGNFYYYLSSYNNQTGDVDEYDTGKIISSSSYPSDLQNGNSNFFFHSTGIYFLNLEANDARYLRFSDYTFQSAGTIPSGANVAQNDAFNFYSSTFGFYCITLNGSTYSLYRQSGGGTLLVTLPGIFYQAIITSDSASGITIYFSLPSGAFYKYVIDSSGSSGILTTFSSNISAYGLFKSGNNIYFYSHNSKENSIYYPFAYIDTTSDVITTIYNGLIYIETPDYAIRQNSLVYVSGVIYLITPGGRFYQFTTANTNRINGTYDSSDKSIRDCLNEFCRIYNLIYILKPNKTLVIFPRSDSSGNIQTNGSASNLTIDTSTIVNVQKKLTDFGKATKVKVKSNGFTGEYNGTDYDVFDADGEKIIEIESDLLQHSNGWTLRDMAKHFYPFYSKELNVLNCEYGILPAIQYEVTDGANVDLSGTKLNIYGSQNQYWNNINEDWQNLLLQYNSGTNTGLIQKQTINPDGSINLEILI